ncbi:hypothetical protein GCM10012320_17000 [Sinomonas cellulolyticus]|jgi:hypothetical protein|uniref:Uncharacterized protein n=1 Tax=Sinomonas cellulolyticus TaxID=2801916 RepID=A0ABS1JYS8_9MICC|nr:MULTISPECIES: hypothetical protein [Sinomonas]MBL0704524.1 hypothetical protein [Sinomonas cellulolyticus]GHG49177.1 hypothetical protein GCM10012320_17000 [Sinomonas sp. KCTC 49339]
MQKLTPAELAAESVEMLPTRETLVFDLNMALVQAQNASYAINAETWGSVANSGALQAVSITQY